MRSGVLLSAFGIPFEEVKLRFDFSEGSEWNKVISAITPTKRVPVMLHRAIVGSLERFIGILIENYAGALPLWLAPVQVEVLNISDAQAEYTTAVAAQLRKLGYRVHADLRNEKITYKIREHSVQKVPYILVIGDKERDANTVAVRARGNVDLGVMSVEALVERLKHEIDSKA